MFQTLILKCMLDMIYTDVPQVSNFNFPLHHPPLLAPTNTVLSSKPGSSPMLSVSIAPSSKPTFIHHLSVSLCLSLSLTLLLSLSPCPYISIFSSYLINHHLYLLYIAWLHPLPPTSKNYGPDSGPHHLWKVLQLLPNLIPNFEIHSWEPRST